MSKKSMIGIGFVMLLIVGALASNSTTGGATKDEAAKTDKAATTASMAPSTVRVEQANVPALEDSVRKSLATLRHVHDKVEGTDFYYEQTSPRHINDRSNLSLYIGQKGGEVELREENVYVAQEWLFIESYTIVADGLKFTIDGNDLERDNREGIWEWQDKEVDSKMTLAMFSVIANAKDVTIRYNGRQYSHDRQMSTTEKNAIGHVLGVYNMMVRLNTAKGIPS